MSRTRRRLGLACTTWGSPADVSRCKKLEVIQLLTVRLEFCTSPRCSTSGAVLTCDTSLLPDECNMSSWEVLKRRASGCCQDSPHRLSKGCCDDGQVIRVMHTYQDLREVVGCPTRLLSTLAMPMSHKRADERHRDRSSPTLWVHATEERCDEPLAAFTSSRQAQRAEGRGSERAYLRREPR